MCRSVAFVVFLLLAGCNLNTENTTAIPVATPNIPRVQFIEPQSGDRMVEGFDLTIDVVGQDDMPGAGIAKIELYLDGQLIREATPEDNIPTAVFRAEMNWFAEGVGLHALSAIAYRRDGTRSDEALLNVEVVNE